jgi:hypothetical protein
MRAVKRLRTLRFHSYVMPVLLAALVFRVLAPPGFMMGGAGPMSLLASMCATTPGKIESIELPGSSQPHCEYCVAPPLGAPLAELRAGQPVRASTEGSSPVVAQRAGLLLARAQSARAPPSA